MVNRVRSKWQIVDEVWKRSEGRVETVDSVGLRLAQSDAGTRLKRKLARGAVVAWTEDWLGGKVNEQALSSIKGRAWNAVMMSAASARATDVEGVASQRQAKSMRLGQAPLIKRQTKVDSDDEIEWHAGRRWQSYLARLFLFERRLQIFMRD